LQILAKMNDLMTKSFLSYVDLKKQAQKDIEANLEDSDEPNLSQFFQEVDGRNGRDHQSLV
jgi:syntaxin 1B/2/3